jgi:hypothetical protein
LKAQLPPFTLAASYLLSRPLTKEQTIAKGFKDLNTIPEGALVRLAMIGAAVASVAGCFAYVAGWLSPHRLTPARLIGGERCRKILRACRSQPKKSASLSSRRVSLMSRMW